MTAFAASLVTLDPGHFHAALVQRRACPEFGLTAKVFAPDGPELDAHLRLVESFNARAERPTVWREEVCCGDDFLERFVAAAKAGKLGENPVVVLAGRNDRKPDYALAAVEAGCHVLADKPLAITSEAFEKTARAVRLARERGLRFADVMTERYEITAILQRELSQDRELYGEQDPGTPEDPSVVEESVHHFCKLVNGNPLRRPEWYYDTAVQGEGIADVTTHLVDLVQWQTFPGVRLAASDVEVLSARTWPTRITPEQFRMSTGGVRAAAFDCAANGAFTWRLRGVCCRVSVAWDFMAAEGAGDTHRSLMRGTQAELVVEQGAREGYRPVLYVKARGDVAATERALAAALARMSAERPGVTAAPTDSAGVWRIAYPPAYDIGHEAHFERVVRAYLDALKSGASDRTETDNLLVKYHTIVEAWKLAHGVSQGSNPRNPIKKGVTPVA